MSRKQERTSALLQKLGRLLKEMPEGVTVERVHDLRTTVRRLETLGSALCPSAFAQSKPVKRLSRLRRRAGKVRDLDVQMGLLSNLRIEAGVRDKARLLHSMESMRDKQAKRLVKLVRDVNVRSLQKSLRRLLAVPAQPAPVERRRREQWLAQAMDQFAGAVRRRPQLQEQNLHDFRMECKRVRYLAEMAVPHPRARAWVERLKRIQDAAGEWHDSVVLCQRAEGLLDDGRPAPLVNALRIRAHNRLSQALQIIEEQRRALLAMRAEVPRKAPASAAQSRAAVA
jgi:CHAD domain-containing protein